MLTHPKSYSSKDYILAPRGRCRLQFLHALENDQGFLPHTPLATGVPQTIFYNKNSKNGLKFRVPTPITLGPGGVTPPTFPTWRATRQAWSSGYNFWGTVPLRIWEGKNRPKFGAILRNFTLRSRISPILRNGWRYRQAENGVIASTTAHVCWKKIGEVWSTNKKVIGAHADPPKVKFFERLYFDP